jgi:hypothetical protein
MKAVRWSISAMVAAGLLLAVVVGVAWLSWKLLDVQTPPLPPKMASDWHNQVYGLDADEVVRFVPPPYSPQRIMDFGRGWAGAPPKNQLGQLGYHVTPTRTIHWGMSSGTGNLASAIVWCTGLTQADLDLPKDLGYVAADGDWITRIDSPIDRRMQALESTLSLITGKHLLFEKRPVESNVIVARGTYAFHEDESYSDADIKTGRQKARLGIVHLYTRPLSPIFGGGGGTGSMAEFLKRIEETCHRKVIDEVSEPRPASIEWSNNHSQYLAAEKEAKLDELLAVVKKQTSLQFSKEKRPVPVWFIRERSATTQAAVK